MSLNARAWLALVVVTVVMCALLFGSAGTIRYWQAWVYVAIFAVASVPTSVYPRAGGPVPRQPEAPAR